MLHVRFTKVNFSALQLIPWQLLLAGIFLVGLAVYIEPNPTIHWSLHLGELLLYIGPIATGFGGWAVVEINRRLPAATSSISLLGIPVVGVLSSAIIWNQFSLTTVISLLLLISGIALATVQFRPQRKNHQTEH